MALDETAPAIKGASVASVFVKWALALLCVLCDRATNV